MATTTNFGWETPDDTDLVKDGALAMRTLGNAIDTSLVDLKGGTTGQVLSKTSNTDMDFTWVTSDDANAIQNAIVDAKGDLISATAADTPARLAVGSNNQLLMADSSTATGLKWAIDPTQDLVTSAGDILYGTGADTLTRLGIGSAGQVLTVSSGIPAWTTISTSPTFRGCRLTASGTQSISNNTSTNLTWNQESFDTDGFHDNATNNDRITIPTGLGGYYLVTATILWENNTTGIRNIYIQNSVPATLVSMTQGASNSGADGLSMTTNAILNLTAGTILRVNVFQNSGAARTVDKTSAVGNFSVQYLGA